MVGGARVFGLSGLGWLILATLGTAPAAWAQGPPTVVFTDLADQPEPSLLQARLFKVRVEDPAAAGAGSVFLTVTSDVAGDAESVLAYESGLVPGVFRAQVAMATQELPPPAVPQDGTLTTSTLVGSEGFQDFVRATYNGTEAVLGVVPFRITLLDDLGAPATAAPHGAPLTIQVEDARAASPSFEGRAVTLSLAGGDQEFLTAAELEREGNVFQARVAAADGPAIWGDNRLQGPVGATVTAAYSTGTVTFPLAAARLRFLDERGRPGALPLQDGTARLELLAVGADSGPLTRDTTTVTVTSERTGDSETFTVTEVDPASGLFVGEIALRVGEAAVNGQLEVGHGSAPQEPLDRVLAAALNANAAAEVTFGRLRFLRPDGTPASQVVVGRAFDWELIRPGADTPGVLDSQYSELTGLPSGQQAYFPMAESGAGTGTFRGHLDSFAAGALGLVEGGEVRARVFEGGGPYRILEARAGLIARQITLLDRLSRQPIGELLEGQSAVVRLDSPQEASLPGVAETVQIYVTTEVNQDAEYVTLQETGLDTGLFEGWVTALRGSPNPGDGTLAVTSMEIPFTRADAVRFHNGGGDLVVPVVGSRLRVTAVASGTRLEVELDAPGRLTSAFPDLASVTISAAGDQEFLDLFEQLPAADGAMRFTGSLPLGLAVWGVFGDQALDAESGSEVVVRHDNADGVTFTEARVRLSRESIEILGADGEPTPTVVEGLPVELRVVSPAGSFPGFLDTLQVEVSTTTAGDSETVTLTETGPSTGIYRGSIRLVAPLAANLGDGLLQGADDGPPWYRAERVTAVYGLASATATTHTMRLELRHADGRPAAEFGIGEPIHLRLTTFEAADDGVSQTRNVTVRNTNTGETEFVTVTETGPASNVYQGVLATLPASAPGGPDSLGVAARDHVRAEAGDRYERLTVAEAVVVGARVDWLDRAGEATTELVENSLARVRVWDASADEQPGAIDHIEMRFASELLGDWIQTSISETGPNTGVFEGAVHLRRAYAADPNNGALETGTTFTVPVIRDQVVAERVGGGAQARALLVGALVRFVDTNGAPVASFASGDRVGVEVERPLANSDFAVRERISAVVSVAASGDVETVELVETTRESGIFRGSIALAHDPGTANPGTLEAAVGALLQAVHHDEFGQPSALAEAVVADAAITFETAAAEPTAVVVVGELARVRARRLSADVDPQGLDTLAVTVRSALGGDVEPLLLTETGAATHEFITSLPVAFGVAVAGDGTLQVGAGSANDEATVELAEARATAEVRGARVQILDSHGRLATVLAVGEAGTVEIFDTGYNVAGQVDSFPLLITSLPGGALANLTATETGPDSGWFRAPFTTQIDGPSVVGGVVTSAGEVLEVSHGPASVGLPVTAELSVVDYRGYFVDAAGHPVAEVLEGAPLRYELLAPRLDRFPVVESVQVVFSSWLGLDGTDRFVPETGPSTGRFSTQIPTFASFGPADLNDQTLQVSEDAGPPLQLDRIFASVQLSPPEFVGPFSEVPVIPSRTAVLSPVVPANGSLGVRVEDFNIRPGAPTTAAVTVRSLVTGDVESLGVPETGPGEFTGTVLLAAAAGAVAGDGVLGAAEGEEVEVTHADALGLSESFARALVGPSLQRPPVAVADAATTAEETAVEIAVKANDSDPDGDALTVTALGAVSPESAGTSAITAGGVTFTPAANFVGTASFGYTVADPGGLTATATVTVTVSGVNDAPAAVGDSLVSLAEVAGTVAVLANDSDVDGDPLTVTTTSAPANGGVSIGAGGVLTYTPNPGFIGNDSFTYTVSDGHGGSAVGTVAVAVNRPARVDSSLQVLYTFNEGAGTTVQDVSGVGTPLPLTLVAFSNVSWQPGRLAVNGTSLLQTAGAAAKVITASRASNEVTVEAWVVPRNTTQTGPAAIVALSQSTSKRNFTLGQTTSRWDSRLRTSTTGNAGATQQTALGTLTTTLTHVVFTRDAAGNARTYINGVLTTSGTMAGNFSTWVTTYRLGVANELAGGRPWLGDLDLVAVYSRALTGTEVRQNFLSGAQ